MNISPLSSQITNICALTPNREQGCSIVSSNNDQIVIMLYFSFFGHFLHSLFSLSPHFLLCSMPIPVRATLHPVLPGRIQDTTPGAELTRLGYPYQTSGSMECAQAIIALNYRGGGLYQGHSHPIAPSARVAQINSLPTTTKYQLARCQYTWTRLRPVLKGLVGYPNPRRTS